MVCFKKFIFAIFSSFVLYEIQKVCVIQALTLRAGANPELG